MYPASTVAWRDPTRQDSGRKSKAALNSGGFEMVSSSTRASSASNGNGGETYGRTTLDRIRRKKNDGPAVVHISLKTRAATRRCRTCGSSAIDPINSFAAFESALTPSQLKIPWVRNVLLDAQVKDVVGHDDAAEQAARFHVIGFERKRTSGTRCRSPVWPYM